MFFWKKRIYNTVVKTSVEALGIPKQEAENRVNALLKSGLLDGGHPENVWFQMIIENFMRFNKNVSYKKAFEDTLNFPDFIREYDIRQKTNLGIELHIARLNKGVHDSLVEEIKKFDAFFFENFWKKMRFGYGETVVAAQVSDTTGDDSSNAEG